MDAERHTCRALVFLALLLCLAPLWPGARAAEAAASDAATAAAPSAVSSAASASAAGDSTAVPMLSPAEAPTTEPSTGGGAAAGNAMNPNLSVIAWLQAHGGSPRVNHPAFEEREAEIGLQSVVDPYARADFFLSVGGDGGIDLEEGYLTLTQLPAGLGLKVGKFRNKLGKFNQTHSGETPFADRPLVAQNFFGQEGLSSTGLSGSYLIPNPWDAYLNLETEVTVPPLAEAGTMFARPSDRNQLLYLGRLTGFFDLSDATNLNLSTTLANGPANVDLLAGLAPDSRRATVAGGELTFRWKNPRRSIYRSLVWQTEGYLAHWKTASELVAAGVAVAPTAVVAADEAPAATTGISRTGLFSYLDYQFVRRMHTGVRFDISQTPGAGGGHETGQLAFLTFTPSEFMLLSGQVRHVRNLAGGDDWNEFLKLTFNIGPHGAHPF